MSYLESKMPPSGAPDGESNKAWVRRILREVVAGREDPEGFFALCVSVLGHQETRSQYLSYIEPLSTANSSLHSVLASIYEEYFAKVSLRTKKRDTLKICVSKQFIVQVKAEVNVCVTAQIFFWKKNVFI